MLFAMSEKTCALCPTLRLPSLLSVPTLSTIQGKVLAEQYSADQGVSRNTRLVGWSMSKSVTSALIGLRTGDGAMSVHNLAGAPVWNTSEASSRNITGAALGP